MTKPILLTALSLILTQFTWSQCETVQWGDNFGGNLEDRQRNSQLAVCPDGGAVAGAVFQSATVTIGSTTYNNPSFSSNRESSVVAKYDANGNVVWSDLIGGGFEDSVEGLASDQNNNVYAVGGSRSDTMYYMNNSMFTLKDSCDFDFFIIKYNAQGVAQWDARPENPSNYCSNGQGNSILMDVVTDDYGNIYAGGYFNSDTLIMANDTIYKTSALEDEVFIVKLDTSGNLIWAQAYGFSSDESMSLAVDGTGNVFYTGNFMNANVTIGTYNFVNSNPGTGDVLTIKFDPNGNIIWGDAAGGTNEDLTLGSTTDSDGNLYIIGGFLSTSLTFGSVTINNSLGVDMYLVKYLPNGTVDWGFTGTGTAIRYGMDVSTSPDNEVYITGLYVFGPLNFGSVSLPTPTTVNGFIVKFDQQGNALWGTTPTTSDSLSTSEIEISSTGDIYNTGTFKDATMDFDGLTLNNTGNGPYDNFIYKFAGGIQASTSTNDATCQMNDGDASVTVNGGTGPYDYAWTSGDTLANADSLTSGFYTVTVTDVSGCTAFATAVVNDISGPTVAANTITDITCSGDNDGAIDITISGGVPPYAITWSNGATTEDLTGLEPGPYEVTVTDNAGCVTISSYTVTEPNEMMFSTGIVQPGCQQSDGSATVLVSGGNMPYSYSWSTGGSNATENNLAAGAYWVTITDNNGCADSTLIAISNVNAPNVAIDSIVPTTCGNSSGTIFTTVTGGLPSYDYVWSNGFTLPNLAGAAAGVYSVEVTDQNNCIGVASATIGTGLVSDPVCMVSVDSASQRNLVIWQKTGGLGISHYNIYRESSQLNLYQLAGTVPFDSLSEFVDSIADPKIRSWRYKISAADSCGNESNKTDAHKTIHLTSNIGLSSSVNLLWDDYEGFAYSTYFVYRHTNTLGWEQIAAVSTSSNSLTDFPPTFDGLYYSILIDHPSGCVVTRAAGNNNTARSNEAELASGPNGIEDFENNMLLSIYPNPTNGVFNVAIGTEDATDVQLEIFDVQGKVILTESWNGISGNHVQTLDLSNEESGIYFFRAKTTDNVLIRKLVIR
jgi:hypothetical protein